MVSGCTANEATKNTDAVEPSATPATATEVVTLPLDEKKKLIWEGKRTHSQHWGTRGAIREKVGLGQVKDKESKIDRQGQTMKGRGWV